MKFQQDVEGQTNHNLSCWVDFLSLPIMCSEPDSSQRGGDFVGETLTRIFSLKWGVVRVRNLTKIIFFKVGGSS